MELNDWVILITALGGIEGVKQLLKWFFNRRYEQRREDASADKAEDENIKSYAAEWKELYEKKEKKVTELDAKIDQLYAEKNEDRVRIRELMQKNQELELKNQSLDILKCKKRGCPDREPPSDY